jgi:hypothetical protein
VYNILHDGQEYKIHKSYGDLSYADIIENIECIDGLLNCKELQDKLD